MGSKIGSGESGMLFVVAERSSGVGGSGAGSVVPGAMVSASLRTVLCLCALAGLFACTQSPPQPKRPKRTPVLIITLDTVRADRLGCYGSKKGLTPFLDDFSREGDVFSDCECAVPLTLPSHVVLFSGIYPIHSGLQANISNRVSRDVPLLAEAFRGEGYATAAFISAAVLLRRYGLDRGFDLYDQGFYQPRGGQYQRAASAYTLSKAEDWLASQEEPFFCWIHLYDAHYPYQPPEPWATKFKKEPYDGTIAYMDASLREFFNRPALQNWRDWYVFICSDHGESLGDHKEPRHGTLIYESTMRVPLLIHLPGQISSARRGDRVSLIDIAPTLRDFLDLPKVLADGTSMKTLFEGKVLPRRDLFMESLNGTVTFGWAPLFGIVQGPWKYIDAPKPELYNLSRDPAELRNLVGSDANLEAQLKASVKGYEGIAPIGATAMGHLSEVDKGQLAGLGYLQGGFSKTGSYARDPKDFVELEDMFLQVSLALKARDSVRAERILKEIEARDPEDPYLYFYKGQLAETRFPDKAAAAYERAVGLAPTHVLSWSLWVRLLLNQGKIHDAAGVARKALTVCGDDMGYFNVALAEEAFFDGRNPDEIRGYLNEALASDPHFARAYLVSFELDLRQRLKEQAEADTVKLWTCATQDEIDSWAKDPIFKNFFEATPRNASREPPPFLSSAGAPY